MAFLLVNGIEIPVQDDSWTYEPVYGGVPDKRMFDGSVGTFDTYTRGAWQGTTGLLTPDQIRAFAGLLGGKMDLFNYESTKMRSSRGLPATGFTRSTSSPKFGLARAIAASGGTGTLSSKVANASQCAVFTYKNDLSGEYGGAWTHLGYRSSDGFVYEDGVYDATETATNWMTVSAPDILLLGKNDAGTNATARYDNTVVCWFDPTDEMMAAWSAADYEWPLAPPFIELTGDAITQTGRSASHALGVVGKIVPESAIIDGVWYEHAGRIEFECEERIGFYEPDTNIEMAALSGSVSTAAAAMTVTAAAGLADPTNYWTFDDVDIVGNRCRDLVGNSPATLVNCTKGVTGKVGQAVTLDGSTSYVEFPKNPLVTNAEDFSFAFWFNTNTVAAGTARILQTRGTGTLGTAAGWLVYRDGSQLKTIFEESGGTYKQSAGGGTLSAATWHHVVGTFENSTGRIRLYLDGNATAIVDETTAGLIGGDLTPIAGRGSTMGASRVDATLAQLVDGEIEDVAFWKGTVLTGANATTIEAAGAAGNRFYEPTFTPTAVVGAPFADYNAETPAAGALTSWANDGSDATGTLATNPGSSNDPQVIDDGDGPCPGAKRVEFDLANTEALQGTLTTTRSTGSVFAAVVRWNSSPSSQYLFDGSDVTNRHALITKGTGANFGYSMFAGSQPYSQTDIEVGRWVRIVGRFGTDGMVSVERATRIAATTGTNSLGGLTLGGRYNGANFADMDLARLVMWEDGTTVLEAERWLEEAYPFDVVPAGNPVHHWDPNDYWESDVPYLTDQGSGDETLTCTALSVELDSTANGCPEQKTFEFNGTTSRAVDDGAFSLTGDVHLFGFCARFVAGGSSEVLLGSDTGGTAWDINKATGNTVQRDFGTIVNSNDLDTLAPFNTPVRWVNIQSLTAAAAGSGGTYTDGTLGGVSDEGDNDPDSLSVGCQAGANYFTGNMSDVIIYTGSDEANAARAAEVEMWLQRQRKLSTLPGAPFVDVDAESLALTDADPVSTWVNDGSTSNLVQTSTERPTFKDADGPELDVGALSVGNSIKRVNFDGSDDYVESTSTFTAETQPGAAAFVFRNETDPSAGTSSTLTQSDTAGTSWNIGPHEDSGSVFSRLNAGSGIETAVDQPNNVWHWMCAEVSNTTSEIRDSSGGAASGTAGSESYGTRARIGAASGTPSNFYDGDVARAVLWGDGTTWEEVAEWLARRYPGVDPY